MTRDLFPNLLAARSVLFRGCLWGFAVERNLWIFLKRGRSRKGEQIMSDSDNSSGGVVTGFILGTLIGAGITFLFGTKKGKELREKIREEYPEIFDQLEESFSDVKENLSEKYAGVASEMKKIKEEAGSTGLKRAHKIGKAPRKIVKQIESVKVPKKRRFFKGKKPL